MQPCLCTLGMGSHSKESQKRKRSRQRKKKRCQSRNRGSNFVSSCSNELDSEPATSQPLVDLSDSDEPLFSILDRLAERYWEKTGKDVDDVESYRDLHPTIITDKDRHIEVLAAGERQDTSGIVRVSTEEYFSQLHKRELKSSSLCKSLRDQVEALEEKVQEMEQEMTKAQRETRKAVGRVRNFWRNKILEEGSYGGAVLMAALRGQHSYK